jgi:hypothetical protein
VPSLVGWVSRAERAHQNLLPSRKSLHQLPPPPATTTQTTIITSCITPNCLSSTTPASQHPPTPQCLASAQPTHLRASSPRRHPPPPHPAATAKSHARLRLVLLLRLRLLLHRRYTMAFRPATSRRRSSSSSVRQRSTARCSAPCQRTRRSGRGLIAAGVSGCGGFSRGRRDIGDEGEMAARRRRWEDGDEEKEDRKSRYVNSSTSAHRHRTDDNTTPCPPTVQSTSTSSESYSAVYLLRALYHTPAPLPYRRMPLACHISSLLVPP